MMVPIEFPEALHFYGPMLGTSVASPSASRPYHTVVIAFIMCFIRQLRVVLQVVMQE
jgi:hypothetical protein